MVETLIASGNLTPVIGPPGPSGTLPVGVLDYRCTEAFLAEAHADGLSTRGGDNQLTYDALIACAHGSPDIHEVAAAVRAAEPYLTGGSPVMGDEGEDVPATGLAWAGTRLCGGWVL